MSAKNQPPLAKTKDPRLQDIRHIQLDWASGNEAKFLGYSEAWARIVLASKRTFNLEAVTIEESMASDRMLSFLEKSCGAALSGQHVSNR